jgi:hypothetical protein
MSEADAEVPQQLRAAFPPEAMTAQGAFDPWGNGYPDAEPYEQQLDGRSWEALDAAYLVRRSDALGFLGTKHLVALLPVYLRSMLREGVWSPAAGMLTIILEKPAPGNDAGAAKCRGRDASRAGPAGRGRVSRRRGRGLPGERLAAV